MTRATGWVDVPFQGVVYRAPYGFGKVYRNVLQHQAKFERVHCFELISSALALVGYDVAFTTVAEWTKQQRVEAHAYAWLESLAASDNPVRRLPRPAFLGGPPWQGDRNPTRNPMNAAAPPRPTLVRSAEDE